jgi:hypothetical protein
MVAEAVLVRRLKFTAQDAANVRLVTEEAFDAMSRDPEARRDRLSVWTPAAV